MVLRSLYNVSWRQNLRVLLQDADMGANCPMDAMRTGLVPLDMAMNLRVPEELDRELEQLAIEQHTSKSALLLQGAEMVLRRHRRRREIAASIDFVQSHDAELLSRLADA